jgi:guanylate kinase
MTEPSTASGGRGRLIVVSGPSGVGKTAVVGRLLEDRRFGRAITATTRPPRPGEREGVDYVFLPEDEFLRRLAAGWFLEHAEVYGRYYGTPKESVERVLETGCHCVLVIDTQGAATLRGIGVDAVYVFLLPPNLEELVRRLTTRGGDSPESRARRLEEARRELAEADRFDHRIVNEVLEDTVRKVAAAVGVRFG